MLLILFLGSWEGFWRIKGFQPGLRDSPGLWSIERRKVKGFEPQQVVLIGASHIQLDLDPEVFAEAMHTLKPVQLAIDGSSFIPVLSSLAEDKSFQGIVICDFLDSDLVDYPSELDRSQEYVDFNKNLNVAQKIDQHLAMPIQNILVSLLPELNPQNLINSVANGRWPDRPYLITYADRSRKADYTKINLEARRKYRIKRTLEIYETISRNNEIDKHKLERIAGAIDAIQARGGKVIMVRFPTSGPLWELDEKYFPRKKYWDYLAKNTSAIMIHFEDYPSLAKFQCPDYAHLDYRDSPEFTRALAKIIKDKIEMEDQNRR